MSAFIVAPECVERLVTFLLPCREFLKENPPPGVALRPAETYGQRLYNSLMSMNVAAVNQRYGERHKPARHKFQHRGAPLVQVYKDAQCLSYQCMEGDVPDSAGYKWLEAVTAMLKACYDAEPHPTPDKAYNDALWGD